MYVLTKVMHGEIYPPDVQHHACRQETFQVGNSPAGWALVTHAVTRDRLASAPVFDSQRQ